MKLPLTPFLLAVELIFLLHVFRNASEGKRLPPARLTLFWSWILLCAAVATYVGFLGVYASESLLKYFPGFWLQSIPVIACIGPVLLNGRLRDELRRAVDGTPREHFILFHMLRLSAVGTLIGAGKHEFPMYFEILVGIPDLIFALSTFWVLRLARTSRLTRRAFLYWNLVGALVIVPAAPVLIQLGLPGRLQLFTGQPDATAVFAFPMSIASVFGVPLFVLVNLMLVWRLWERRPSHNRRRIILPAPAWTSWAETLRKLPDRHSSKPMRRAFRSLSAL